jgi:membrane associated rhomboid family serine protease
MNPVTPVVRNLLLACGAVFLLQLVLPLDRTFALWPLDSPFPRLQFEPWQLVTYAFLHGGWTHLIINMFVLWNFGPEVERLLGSRRFTTYYAVCVVGAALTQLLVLKWMDGPVVPTVGASGGIYGILLAFGLAFPHRKLMLIFPPIPMPAWLLVTLSGLIELYSGITGTAAGVAHFAHLGGMVGGFALILYWRGRVLRR